MTNMEWVQKNKNNKKTWDFKVNKEDSNIKTVLKVMATFGIINKTKALVLSQFSGILKIYLAVIKRDQIDPFEEMTFSYS